MRERKTIYADDDYESIGTLLKIRTPTLAIGLILGIGISFLASNFEEVLEHNVQIAFFLPFVVYIASAIGNQTDSIYSRDLKSGRAKFSNYLWKETLLGFIFGTLFGAFSGAIVFLWFKDNLLAISVGISTFLAIATAPIIALLITQIFKYIKKDPSAGSGPIATVIQDMISVTIYGTITSLIIL